MEFLRPVWNCLATFCSCLHCSEDLGSQGYEPSERTHLLTDPINNSPVLRCTTSDNLSNDYSQSLPKKDEQNALSRLVQNTAINMIDVGAMDSHHLEHQEYNDRIKLYSHRLQQQWSSVQHPGTLLLGLLKDVANPEYYLTVSPMKFEDLIQSHCLVVWHSIASKEQLIVRHIDAKTAFLNGKLNETIFMKQPPGFEENSEFVCLLKKSLYGLKQAAKSWYDAIHAVLIDEGFQQGKADQCLYSRKKNSEWSFLLIYVDDMIVAAKSIETVNVIKEIIASKFELQDLGEIKFCLGIEIFKDAKNIYYSCQSRYIQRIAAAFGLNDAKISNVPMNVNYNKADTDDNILLTNADYQRLIGCLLYISVNTRPDISASVSILAQRVQQPRQQDWNELKRVLRYLKGTANVKLALSSYDDSGEFFYGYADANWAENKKDRKSNTGYVFIVNGGIVSWACRKQNCVALLSTEAEFIALSEACQEAFWLRRLLNDLQQPVQTATIIFEDNQSCLKLIEEEKLSNRTKHVDTRYHFVKDYVQQNFVSCVYCCSEDMLADLLTKPLPAKRHIMLLERCGLN